ncbi:MAG TPA: exodeoxyribonuclease VII small subunit [Miltoncostaeaceae bacterium]|nr:exodeoxyribonuclease VII small subunit [Miltoncostaeaceae bacterium]
MNAGDDAPRMTFEQALAALDGVVRRLEAGDVGLEEAIGLFEEGRRHLAACRERLAAAQQRIEELTAEDGPSAPPPF